MATVRYIVDDVDAAVDFYSHHFGFDLVMHPAPANCGNVFRRGPARATSDDEATAGC